MKSTRRDLGRNGIRLIGERAWSRLRASRRKRGNFASQYWPHPAVAVIQQLRTCRFIPSSAGGSQLISDNCYCCRTDKSRIIRLFIIHAIPLEHNDVEAWHTPKDCSGKAGAFHHIHYFRHLFTCCSRTSRGSS